MPFPIPAPDSVSNGGLPARLLRPLIAQRRTQTVDPTDGSTSSSWETLSFAGRIARGTVTEIDDQGRQASVTRQTLLTNWGGLRGADRIIDPDSDETPTWELDGDPVEVWADLGIHHYEVPLRQVTG